VVLLLVSAKWGLLFNSDSLFLSLEILLSLNSRIEGLRLKHQGSQGQLKPEEREEIIQWLTNQNHAQFIRPRKLYSRAVSD
jgi:hypothetical protein